MKKILLLESDFTVLSALNNALQSKGYLVARAQSLDRAEELLRQDQFDLLLCERTLSDGDVVELLSGLRERRLFMRTLVISRRKSLVDRLTVLKLANDFLAKPFDLTELFLKIENLLSLEKVDNSDFIENSTLLLRDDSADSLKKGFRPQELKILECLFKHKNLVVSYETIAGYVWGYKELMPLKKTINVYIRRIRGKFNLPNKYIETVKNRGYRLVEMAKADC